ncbi:MAG: recombinase family protein [Lachnospiraceae bacterium]|nr:recombinase family protein [Lachnospiraceae bacterium]
MKRITKIDALRDGSKRKLRVAAYARVSTGSDEQLVSLETQKNHYEKYIKARPDWEYAGLYYDEGVTGTSMAKRDGLKRMLDDCDRGLIDYIVVKSISRFSRNTVESIETVRKLCEKGIYIFFEKENIDTGKMEGELMLSILSSLAESESHSISENYRWSIQRRFQNGTYKSNYMPYGYDSVDGRMVINEEEAEIVRRIFNSFLSGKSAQTIAKELNAEGIPAKRGNHWAASSVNGMIKNEKYIGDAVFQKSYTDDMFSRHVNHGERSKYYVRDHHDAIISREDFETVNAILARNGMDKGIRKDDMKYQNRYAMSGKIICGQCGGKMKRVKLNGYFGFACKTHLKDKNLCDMRSIPEETVKAAFATMMNKLTWGRSRVLLPYAQMLKQSTGENVHGRLAELDDLIEKNNYRRTQITQFFTKGLLDPAVYTEEINALDAETGSLETERTSLTSAVSGKRELQDALEKILKYTATATILTDFDDILFSEHVDHIIVFSRAEIGFAMKCGPVFRERI